MNVCQFCHEVGEFVCKNRMDWFDCEHFLDEEEDEEFYYEEDE